MKRDPCPIASLFTAILLLSAIPSRADWILDGTPISATTGSRYIFGMLPDGNQGAFIAWGEEVSFQNSVVVARITGTGDVLWTRTMPVSFVSLSMTSDGAGGVQIVGERGFNHSIMLQRLDGGGNEVFSSEWKVVGQPTHSINAPTSQRLADGTTQVAWLELVTGGWTVAGQRVDAQGNPLWEMEGRQLVPSTHTAYNDVAVVPGAGGSFFVAWNRSTGDAGDAWLNGYLCPFTAAGAPGTAIWTDYSFHAVSDGADGAILTSSSFDPWDVFAVRLVDDGTSVWGRKAVSTASGTQTNAVVVPDGLGGGIIAWDDYRSGNADPYAQRIDASGELVWTSAGLPVITAPGYQLHAAFVADGAGGAVVSWRDAGNLYAQRLGPTGAKLWDSAGVPIVTAPGNQYGFSAVLDGNGGVIFAWTDKRNDPNNATFEEMVYAQRLSLSDGSWGSPVAVAISSFTASVRDDKVVLTARYRGNLEVEAVNVYRRSREPGFTRIARMEAAPSDRFEFVDRSVEPGATYRYQIGVVDTDGEFLSPIAEVTTPAVVAGLEQNHPNPFNPETTISFSLEKAARASVDIYTIDGRHVRTLLDENRGAGFHRVTWDGTDDGGEVVSSGMYLYKLRADKYTATRKMLLLK